MSDLARLRAEVAKRQRAASAKISRIKSNTGAKIAGSEFDPRRNAARTKNYNAKQLQSYLGKLNEFTSRRTQFASLAGGAPAPRPAVKAYKYKAQRAIEARDEHMASMGNIEIKPLGKTVEEFSQRKAMQGRNPTVNSPYGAIVANPESIGSYGALQKLTKDLDAKLNREHLPKKLEQGKEQLLKALAIMGEKKFGERVEELSPHQFDVLWFGTNFAESVFMKYGLETGRAAKAKNKEKWEESVINDAYGDIEEFLDWAESDIPKNTE